MIKKGSSWSCAEQTKDAGNVLLWAADSMVCPT